MLTNQYTGIAEKLPEEKVPQESVTKTNLCIKEGDKVIVSEHQFINPAGGPPIKMRIIGIKKDKK